MGDDQHREWALGHVQELESRLPAETDHILSHLLEECWPGGLADRTDVAALAWLLGTKDGLAPIARIEPSCTCRTGRCGSCN